MQKIQGMEVAHVVDGPVADTSATPYRFCDGVTKADETDRKSLEMPKSARDRASDAILIAEAEPAGFPRPPLAHVPPASEILTAYRVKEVIGDPLREFSDGKGTDGAAWESQELAQATMDALESHICVLNERADIIAVNRAWNDFWHASQRGVGGDGESRPVWGGSGPGKNYLDVCDGSNTPEGAALADAIRAILRGENDSFRMEYPCHSAEEQRWCLCRIRRFHADESLRIVVEHRNVTDRYLASKKLKDSEEQFRLFFRHAPASLATLDRDMRYLQVSRRWLKDFGLEGRNIIGMSHYDLFPEMGEGWKEIYSRALAGEVLKSDRGQFRRSDGSVQWLKWEVLPWRDSLGMVGGLMICTEDITERIQIEEALRLNEERLRLALDAAQIGTFDRDLSTGIGTWSPRLSELFGLPLAESHPSVDRILSIIHPSDREKAKNFAISLGQGNRTRAQYRIIPRPGETRWVEFSGQGITNEASVPTRYIGVAWDVTDRMRLEEERVRAAAELRALASRLQTAAESERLRIARDLHDELGQALTGLKMELEWIIRKHSGGNEALVALIQNAMKLVDSTVDVVRNLSRELRPTMIDGLGLPAAVEWYASEFERRFGIICEVDMPEGTLELSSDRSISAFRIIQEAFTNVARHSQAKNVTVTIDRQVDDAVVTIKDDGIGFSVRHSDGPLSLGLLGMRERALGLGADLSIESVPDHGTSVTLRIPQDPGPAAEPIVEGTQR